VGNNLDAAQIAKYRKDGYVFPVPALTSGEATEVRTGIEDFERRSGLVAGHVIRNKGHLKLTRLYDLVFHSRHAVYRPVVDNRSAVLTKILAENWHRAHDRRCVLDSQRSGGHA